MPTDVLRVLPRGRESRSNRSCRVEAGAMKAGAVDYLARGEMDPAPLDAGPTGGGA